MYPYFHDITNATFALVYLCVPLQSPESIKKKFMSLLVEDSARGIKSYADFLCTAHTMIQNKFLE